MVDVIKTTVPNNSLLQTSLADADFYDAYEAPLSDRALSPTEIFLRASRATPRWVSAAMTLRNQIVHRLGLKDVGAMKVSGGKSVDAYRIGDRLGIFSIFGKTENELLLGIDDRHLDVRVSLMKSEQNNQSRYVVSTVVHTHNRLGRIYMAPVGRIHPLVVRAMMRRAGV
jgi:Protein of unknown function (DUF2867)